MASIASGNGSRIERQLSLPDGDLWIFGYGSLMWRPDFPYVEAILARLHGYHRSLCVWSWVHRGTRHRPGLVMGLDRGGSCIGRAYRVAAGERSAALEYLHDREMATPVYQPHLTTLQLAGRPTPGLVFVVDRGHPQYAGKLPSEHAADVVLRGVGQSGANPEYLAAMVAHLDALGIRDAKLAKVYDLVQADYGLAINGDGMPRAAV